MEKIICTCGQEQVEEEAHCWKCGNKLPAKYPNQFISEKEQLTNEED